MATQIVPTDVLQVRAWTVLGNQAAVNTFGFYCQGNTGAGVTDQDLADNMDTLLSTFYQTIIANQATYRGVQVYFARRAGTLPQPVAAIAGAGPGTGGALALPRNTAAILKYNGFFRGPKYRGRIFIGFLPTDTMTADGAPTNAFRTYLTGLASTLIGSIVVGSPPNTGTFAWVIVNRGTPLGVTEILQASAPAAFGQMHKRGDYGKPNISPI